MSFHLQQRSCRMIVLAPAKGTVLPCMITCITTTQLLSAGCWGVSDLWNEGLICTPSSWIIIMQKTNTNHWTKTGLAFNVLWLCLFPADKPQDVLDKYKGKNFTKHLTSLYSSKWRQFYCNCKCKPESWLLKLKAILLCVSTCCPSHMVCQWICLFMLIVTRSLLRPRRLQRFPPYLSVHGVLNVLILFFIVLCIYITDI